LTTVVLKKGAQSVPDPRVGLVERADFVRLVGELIEMLGWPDARGGLHLLDHLQQGSCRAPVYVTWPLPAGVGTFGEARAFRVAGRRRGTARDRARGR
jgi:hypothetical protein